MTQLYDRTDAVVRQRSITPTDAALPRLRPLREADEMLDSLSLPNVRLHRGLYCDGAAAARGALAAAAAAGGRLGGFFCESILSCGGQIMLPPGYLQVSSQLQVRRPKHG